MATSDIGASRKQVPRHASLLVEISKERRSGRRQGEPSCDGGGLTSGSRAEGVKGPQAERRLLECFGKLMGNPRAEVAPSRT